MKKEIKTNAMRILDNLDIDYEHVDYELEGDFTSAVDIAEKTHEDVDIVYKTLATISKDKEVFVLVIPAADSIDFKKAAKACEVKSLSMLHLKDLKKTVGYERGATTAIAMKKDYPVVLDEKAKEHEIIKVSAGKIGHGLKLRPDDFIKATKGKYGDITQ
ncbi:aminoacyl-tRNA deacylase [Anaerococcus prevotii]|uniref:aminoacyl-tRNA deacylase n=1 Tax=Anaerococcus prevotii TaxID=33034 RepID=UPI0028044C86|nr:aminoacyl-tRNA deacylase [Anaerococcus prevotii]MDU2558871.1 aminoacyl-tRNA deacylase [Anaerococcus prevotii]MDU2583984.1 aminoacyl-tRNA deacylase [Anaerococcus prevotii]